MKQLTLKNKSLANIHNAVYNIPTSNQKINRGKFKLLDLILKKIKEWEADREAIFQEFGKKDDEGNYIPNGDDKYTFETKDTKEINRQLDELLEEEATIVYGEYTNRIKDIMEYLENYEGQIDGQTGQGLYELLETYDANNEEEK